jgi:hypothetical protein
MYLKVDIVRLLFSSISKEGGSKSGKALLQNPSNWRWIYFLHGSLVQVQDIPLRHPQLQTTKCAPATVANNKIQWKLVTVETLNSKLNTILKILKEK